MVPPMSSAALRSSGANVKPAPSNAGIVHLGLGNFHRAHQAVYTSAAMAANPGPWGIIGSANSSRTVASAMAAQDLLYSVVEISPGSADVSVTAAHSQVLVASEQSTELVAAIAAESTKIVTLTVTEHGYTYSPKTLGLALDSPEVRHDLTHSGAPRTSIGQITRGLQRRARTHGAPITVLSCDNLSGNGGHTERLVREFAAALPESESAELLAWIDVHVTFPSTMVDRIVPATTDAHRALVTEHLGLHDAVPVPTEPFTMWVLEDDFAAGRPQWEAGGAIFTDDVTGYELLKLRLLNGTHSLIAHLGMLAGYRYIADAVAEPFIESAARGVISTDYLPTLTVPEQIEIDDYVEQLFLRFGNSALGHRTSQVCTDGSMKLPQRITEPALRHCAEGRVPDRLALTVAAFLCCLAPLGADPAPPGTEDIRDPARKRLAALGATATTARELVESAFMRGHVFSPELAEQTEFLARTAEFVDILRRHGPKAAALEAQR
jgi:fructuronate reductase